jgi:hypothetical protein
MSIIEKKKYSMIADVNTFKYDSHSTRDYSSRLWDSVTSTSWYLRYILAYIPLAYNHDDVALHVICLDLPIVVDPDHHDVLFIDIIREANQIVCLPTIVRTT